MRLNFNKVANLEGIRKMISHRNSEASNSGRPVETSVEYLQQLQMLEALHNDVFGSKVEQPMFEKSLPALASKPLEDEYQSAEQ